MPFVIYCDMNPGADCDDLVEQFAFFGDTESEAKAALDKFAARCEWFQAARGAGDVEENTFEIDADDRPKYGETGDDEDEEEDEEEDEGDEESGG